MDNRPLIIKQEGKQQVLKDFRRIGWGPGAEDRWMEFDGEMRAKPTEEERELWIRAADMALRIATVVAVFRGSKVVDIHDLEWAFQLVEYSTNQIKRGLDKHMLEQLEQAELADRLRNEFRRNGVLTNGQIRKFCGTKVKNFRDIEQTMDQLMKCGDIAELDRSQGPGRPTKRWEWKGN
jgi:hypothetical protein